MTDRRDPARPGRRPHPWQDETRSRRRAGRGLLLAAMTLEEKVGQLGSRWVGNDLAGRGPGRRRAADLQVAPMQDVFAASGSVTLAEASRHGLGHLTRVYGSAPVSVAEGADELVRQHRTVLEASRLGVPALVHEECLTGFTAYGATVYPAAIAWAATWDPDAGATRWPRRIGRDMAALGVHQGLSPVLDVVRDYRWGRVEETIGEDPYLVSDAGRGLRPGPAVGRRDRHPEALRRATPPRGPRATTARSPWAAASCATSSCPPFETAVALGGAGSVMNSYSDVDGVPAGADPWLLTEVLREEWGFEGTVVSDYWAVPFLASMHRVAEDRPRPAPSPSRPASTSSCPTPSGTATALVELVRSGPSTSRFVDRAARRALLAKAQLGLLDAGWTPEGSVAHAAEVDLDSPANRELAREIAERSVVLLDAGTALPIRSERAHRCRSGWRSSARARTTPLTFMGCYAFPNHVLPRHPRAGLGIEVADRAGRAARRAAPTSRWSTRPGAP